MKPKKLRDYKLKDYFGKPIKNSYRSPNPLLNELNIKSYCLLDYIFPSVMEKPIKSTDNVREIQKWEGKGKAKKEFVFLVQSINQWYRMATKEEAEVFKNKK